MRTRLDCFVVKDIDRGEFAPVIVNSAWNAELVWLEAEPVERNVEAFEKKGQQNFEEV